VEDRLRRLDQLLDLLEQVPGPTSAAAMEAVQTLTDVYGEGLARVLAAAGAALVERLHDDVLVQHLLVLHDLDPDPVERRVERAVSALAEEIENRGGRLEIEHMDEEVVRVRLTSTGCSCSSSQADRQSLEKSVEDEILALAPELTAVETVSGGRQVAQAVIPVEALLRRPPPAPLSARAGGLP
jgi:Fe-S cluster biogenesis protein NfuA